MSNSQPIKKQKITSAATATLADTVPDPDAQAAATQAISAPPSSPLSHPQDEIMEEEDEISRFGFHLDDFDKSDEEYDESKNKLTKREIALPFKHAKRLQKK